MWVHVLEFLRTYFFTWSSHWGGPGFIAPALALNLAATNWKALREELGSFDLDVENSLSKALMLTTQDISCEQEELVKVQRALVLKIRKARDEHKTKWNGTRKHCTIASAVLFSALFFKVSHPLLCLGQAPLASHALWKHNKIKCLSDEHDNMLKVLKDINGTESDESDPKAFLDELKRA